MPYLSIPGYRGEVRKKVKKGTKEVAISTVVRGNRARFESLGGAGDSIREFPLEVGSINLPTRTTFIMTRALPFLSTSGWGFPYVSFP